MRLKLTAAALGVAAMMLVLGASGAGAAPTYTVTGGVNLSAASMGPITFVPAGLTLTCSSATGAGAVVDGAGQSGMGIVKFTSMSFNSCSGGLTISGPLAGAPWAFSATSGSSALVTGTLRLATTISYSGCVFTVSGAVPAKYTNSTQIFAINGGGLTVGMANLTCNTGGIYAGDSATFAANLAVTGSPVNPIKITSP